MGIKETVAEILLKINAVSLNPTHPFKYASGLFSPIYTDCRILTSYPDERKFIIDIFIDYINDIVGKNNIDIIIGTASSGISLATYLGQRLNLPIAYVRSSLKDHGKGKQIEGIFKNDYRALLVSDIMSTEKDIPISVRAIKEAGGEVVYCMTIFSNKLGIIEKFLEGEKIRYHSLTDLDVLLEVASINNKISADEKKSVTDWMKNPQEWDTLRRDRINKISEENKEKIAEILLKIKAVTLNTVQPYRYVSGILSPIYTDNRLLMSYPAEWRQVIDSFVNVIVNQIGTQNINIIAGIATAGISHATYLADRMHLPMIYIKSDVDQYGKFTKIEGHIKKRDKVIVLEDLISTGGSSISAVNSVREYGGVVEYCLAIFTYEMKKSKEAFEKENVKLIALTDISTLIKVAVKLKYIKPEEEQIILDWIKDPMEWTKKNEK
jgi:orotate phosphoribosyltransferase